MKRLFNIFSLSLMLAVVLSTVRIPTSTAYAAPLLTPNTWNALGSGLNGLVYAIAVDGTDIYVGGQFTDAGGNANADRIAKWNGTSWSALGSGLNGVVYSIAVRGTDIYVGGDFTDVGGDSNIDYVAQWNGSTWSSLGNGLNNTVQVVAVSGSNVYVAGGFTDAGGVTDADYIAKLDGGTWESLGSTPLNNTVYSAVVAGADVYAGGNFLNAGGDANADYIAHWDGASWSAVGSGISARVSAIALSSDGLYAGGEFSNAGGDANADYIAKWNGTSWSAVGSGLNSVVRAVVIDGQNIYAGGYFTNAGGDASADYIARWDGAAWSAVGTGLLDNSVNKLVINGLDLYAGGNFSDAGGNTSADRIARFEIDASAPTVNSFAATSPTNSLNILITAFTASDNVAVTKYLITESDTPPATGGAGWTSSAPTTYAVSSAGSYTLYPWAKDAGGNVSAVYGSPINVTVDTTAPAITSFAMPSLSADITVPITEFTASDDVAVTGYLVSTLSTPPSAEDNGWTASAPAYFPIGGDGSYTFYPWVKDAAGNVSTPYGSPAHVTVDMTRPAVTAFSVPSSSTSLNVPITTFSASDSVSVTGFLITESSTTPSAEADGWTESAPTTFAVASQGSHTLYPWAKDAAGNVSSVYSSPVTVTVDTTKPTVTSFTAASPSNSLNVPITNFTASDNLSVIGYLINESSTPPSAGAAGWTASAPTTYTIASQGSHTLRPWVKDAAGNVSAVYGSPVTVTVDVTQPVVNSFTAMSPSNSLNIPITNFTASDNISVTGYLITASSTPPSANAAGWTASAPATYTVASQGNYTLHPWVKDAAGNVSAAYNGPGGAVSVDTEAPMVTAFSAPASSNSFNIPIDTFTASNNVDVIGYLITQSATLPSAGATGWTASTPTNYSVSGNGSYALYPWVKDEAGNVSAVYGSPASVDVDVPLPVAAITAFDFASPVVTGVINEADLTISLTVPFGTDVTALVPTITHTGVSVSPDSGVAQDFTNPVTYTVTAVDAVVWHYTYAVTVTVAPDVPADTAPVLNSITRLNPVNSFTNAAALVFHATFSEGVQNVDVRDFVVNGTTTATVTQVNDVGFDAYDITVSGGDLAGFEGPIGLDLSGSQDIQDLAGNSLPAGEPVIDQIYNKILPMVISSAGASDGWILESSETSNKGGKLNTAATTFNLGDDAANRQYRSILSFDTTILPEGAEITKVTLKLKKAGVVGGGNPITSFKGFMVEIREGEFGTAALEAGDFKAPGDLVLGPFKPALVGGWYSLDLTDPDSWINMDGSTQIRLRFKLDDNNNFVANFLKLYSGNANPADQPQLIIEYSD